MKELINYLATSLADKPQEILIAESSDEKATLLQLTAADEDLNHLIGKHGRTIKAMRSLLAASSAKNGHKVFLKIAEDPSESLQDASLVDNTDDIDDDSHDQGQSYD